MSTSSTAAPPRIRKRLPCELRVGPDRHSGIVLNLSEGGVFVQTNAGVSPGAHIDLQLTLPEWSSPIALQAQVVWKRAVTRHLSGHTQSGMGLRIANPPELYYSFVSELLPAGPRPSEPRAKLRCFRVRIALAGGPRSRTVIVHSRSSEDARQQALDDAGEGWTIVELERA